MVAGASVRRARAAARGGSANSRGTVAGAGAPGMGPDDRKLPEAHRMLDERYAKGEISREEYMQRQTDLQSKV
ncbi:MAG: SHOCT domain-containing protein [Armatimonadetes bacterium]|nr:SHOCT domain-containing protein [Armatimonadota bacterium]